MQQNIATLRPGMITGAPSCIIHDTTLPTSFCSSSWDAPLPHRPLRRVTLSRRPVRAAVSPTSSRPPLRLVVPFVLSHPPPPLSCCPHHPFCLIAPSLHHLAPPCRRHSHRPVGVALTALSALLSPPCRRRSHRPVGVALTALSASLSPPPLSRRLNVSPSVRSYVRLEFFFFLFCSPLTLLSFTGA